MLSALLYRDLRLHWGALILPGLLALLTSLSLHRAGENPIALLALALIFALLVPHALHLREEHRGTLGELRALPVSEGRFVAFRFLEGLLSALGVVLLHLILLRVLRGPGAWDGLGAWLNPGWLWMLLLVLALPMPITLRWGGKGWIALVLGAFLLLGGWVGFVELTGHWPLGERFLRLLARAALHLIAHPIQHAALLLGLSLICVPLAVTGLRRRDC